MNSKREKFCSFCGKPFFAPQKNHWLVKYCSTKCRTNAIIKRHLEKRLSAIEEFLKQIKFVPPDNLQPKPQPKITTAKELIQQFKYIKSLMEYFQRNNPELTENNLQQQTTHDNSNTISTPNTHLTQQQVNSQQESPNNNPQFLPALTQQQVDPQPASLQVNQFSETPKKEIETVVAQNIDITTTNTQTILNTHQQNATILTNMPYNSDQNHSDNTTTTQQAPTTPTQSQNNKAT